MTCAPKSAIGCLRGLFVATAAALAAGCGASPITAPRVEQAIAPTFANLVHGQLSRLGLRGVSSADITVIASCRRMVQGGGAAGAGEWECVLVWHGPNQQVLRDTYEVSAATNGCYAATLGGSESGLGGPTLTIANGATVRNVLYAFDGCFDIT